MARGTLCGAAAALACAIALGACGASTADRTPNLNDLPLVPGATIVAQEKRCDMGANAYCAVEFVVVDRRFHSSEDLVHAQHQLLMQHGWSSANADIGPERAADSPGHKLRVTFATAFGELTGIDLGWIKRTRSITLALSRTMVQRQSAMSMMLEIGNG